MNSLAYIGIAIIVIIIVVAALVFTGNRSGNTSTTVATTVASSYPTTLQTTTGTVSTPSGQVSCVPTNSSFSCSNVTFATSNNVTNVRALIGQSMGSDWSGFGIGFAPNGTRLSGGVPLIKFYSTNSTNPTGGNRSTGGSVNMLIYSGSNFTGPVSGTIWACYVNSGILYVVNGCTTTGGSPAQYVKIGTVKVS